MSCKKIKNQLLLFLDNELPVARQTEIQHHLAGCPNCANHLKQLTEIWQSLVAIETIEPSAWLWNRIVAKLKAFFNLRSSVKIVIFLIRVRRTYSS